MALIVYGSLYPWHFEARQLPASPLWMLLHSWGGPLNSLDRRGLSDIVVNIVLYTPLGLSAHLAFRKYRVFGPIVLGGLLSASIEMTQLFVPGRNCSALDLVDNVIGSALGMFAGMALERIDLGTQSVPTRRATDRSALALLYCWIGSLLFPLFPVLSLPALRHKLAVLAGAPLFEAIPWISATLCWFAGGLLLAAAGFRLVRTMLAILLLTIPAQIMIVTRQPEAAVLLGAVMGVAIFCYGGAVSVAARWAGWLFLVLLVVRGLTPFVLLPEPQAFTWIPFGGLLTMSWQPGIQVLLEKTFYYGVAIWLLRAGGMRVRYATLLVAVVLGAIEAAQRYVPERTPEITDPVMAILAGSALWAMGRDSSGLLLPRENVAGTRTYL